MVTSSTLSTVYKKIAFALLTINGVIVLLKTLFYFSHLLSCRCVDLRTVSYEVPPQEMLSRDSVTVSVDAVCFYKISNPLAAVCNVGNYTHSTNLLVATSLRNVLGTKTLAEILSERETICHVMEHILDEATRPWGVKVERVEIKDVRVPVQLQRAMAAEAEAAREARAKVRCPSVRMTLYLFIGMS